MSDAQGQEEGKGRVIWLGGSTVDRRWIGRRGDGGAE